MSNFNIRLRQLRTEAGLSQQELADKIGISKSSINMYERGEREPSFETLEAIADYFNVDMDFLVGKSPYLNMYQHIREYLRTNYFKDDKITASTKVPILGRVAAGIPIEAIEDIIDYEEIPSSMARTGDYFGLKIKGHSMEPNICDGDIVIVKKQSDVESGNIAIVLVNGAEGACKKILKSGTGLTLVSFNPAYDPVFYSNKQIQDLPVLIIGKAVEVRRKLM